MTRPAASNAGCEARTTILPWLRLRQSNRGARMGSKPLVRPPRLTRGSRIALLAPAGPLLERDDLTRAETLCRALDYEPVMGAHAGGHHGYFSGTDDARLADLNTALRDPAVDAIWCIRGGYGVTRILDGVGFEALPGRPRPGSGYSGITAAAAGGG